MRRQYTEVQHGHAAVVLLVGEQGIGKSRLLREFAKHALQDGATVLAGGASEAEGMPPYLPFLEAFGQYIREAPLGQLREQVQPGPQILMNMFPELATRLGELPVPYPFPPEQVRLRIYEAVGMFIERMSASHALVLAIDDLHYADSASLDLLCHVVRSHPNARLLVLGIYREDEIERNPALERTLAKLMQRRILTRIAIEALSAEEIEELAESSLGGHVSPTVSQLLFIQSEGNPFFAEELISSWIENGSIVCEHGQWTAAAPLEHALPQSIVAVLRQRFTQLSPITVDRLRIGAIIGRTFDLSLLAAIECQEAEELEENLLEAVRAGLIRIERVGVFTFHHDKIRECLYAEVSTLRRRRLHEAIGRVLESRYDPELTLSMHQLAELAFHFTQSGDRARGVTYAERAAEQAMRSAAFREAVTYYHLALELLLQDDERRSNLLLGLGEAALLAHTESDAVVAYQEALAILKRSGEREAAAHAAHGLALAQWRQKSLRSARATLEHALALVGEKESASGVRILVDLATLLTNDMDHHMEGMTYAQRAMEMALLLGDSSLEAAANRAVAGKLYAPGIDITFASHSLERALQLAEAGDDPSETAECCFSLARAYYWSADIERSQAVLSRMIAFIDERSQQPYQLHNVLPWLALLHTSRGEWDEAEREIERARLFVERLRSPLSSAFLHQIRGFLAYQQEEYETAEGEFQVATMDQPAGSERHMFFTGLFGLAQVALGKREETYAYAGRLEALLSELPTGTFPTAPITTCLALMALSFGDRERAANLYPVLKAFGGQHHWFLVDRVLGLLATHLHDWDKAAMYLSAAKETAERAGIRPELARTLLAHADFELTRGGQGRVMRATDSLRHALSLFETLHMHTSATHTRGKLHTLAQHSFPSQYLPADLTGREVKVLQLVTGGKSNRQIARELGISEKTVANHLSHIFAKTASENRAAAAAFAIRHGLA